MKVRPTKEQYEEVKDFAESFGVSLKYVKKGWSSCIEDRIIHIDLRETHDYQHLLSVTMHELGHVYCYRNNLYEKYHKENMPKRKLFQYIMRYGLRAEKFVDKVGAQLMKRYYPEIEYLPAYSTKEDYMWYYDWVRRNYDRC